MTASTQVVGIINQSGAQIVTYTYDAWGNLLSAVGNTSVNANAEKIAKNNPLRYRGYVYDTETELYYLQSRYYNPEMGRFLNADALVSTGGLLGNNMFAYCLNNPINLIDIYGYNPGDLFKTVDEAARDAAFYINGVSISENTEYGTYIYSVELSHKELCFFRFSAFGIEIVIPYYKIVSTVYYTYDEPVKGTATTVDLGPPNDSMKIVATFHTHGAYSSNPNHSNDAFSTIDIQTTNFNRIPSYLATPYGTLRMYDPVTQNNIVIYTDIPYDPNHPGR